MLQAPISSQWHKVDLPSKAVCNLMNSGFDKQMRAQKIEIQNTRNLNLDSRKSYIVKKKKKQSKALV